MIDTTELLAEFLKWCMVSRGITTDSQGEPDLNDDPLSLAQEFMNIKYGSDGNNTEPGTPILERE